MYHIRPYQMGEEPLLRELFYHTVHNVNQRDYTLEQRNAWAPDLFKENSGVVAEGKFEADGSFTADNLLAKHDERYMPPQMGERVSLGSPHAGQNWWQPKPAHQRERSTERAVAVR